MIKLKKGKTPQLKIKITCVLKLYREGSMGSMIEKVQFKEPRKYKQNRQEAWDIISYNNLCITAVPEKRGENIFARVILEKFPGLMKNHQSTYTQNQ